MLLVCLWQRFPVKLLKFLSFVILLDLVVCLLAVLLCQSFGWSSLRNFTTDLFYAGTILITCGILSFIGSSGRGGFFDSYYRYTRSSEESYQRLMQNIDLLEGSYNFALLTSITCGPQQEIGKKTT